MSCVETVRRRWRGALQWAPIVVTAALGLGLLTKYESDKHRSQTFLPPVRSALPSAKPVATPPAAGDPAYRRIQALTSCADLQAAFTEAARRVERLPEGRRAAEARSAVAAMGWADDRLAKLRCGD